MSRFSKAYNITRQFTRDLHHFATKKVHALQQTIKKPVLESNPTFEVNNMTMKQYGGRSGSMRRFTTNMQRLGTKKATSLKHAESGYGKPLSEPTRIEVHFHNKMNNVKLFSTRINELNQEWRDRKAFRETNDAFFLKEFGARSSSVKKFCSTINGDNIAWKEAKAARNENIYF
eukprot:g5988.t1